VTHFSDHPLRGTNAGRDERDRHRGVGSRVLTWGFLHSRHVLEAVSLACESQGRPALVIPACDAWFCDATTIIPIDRVMPSARGSKVKADLERGLEDLPLSPTRHRPGLSEPWSPVNPFRSLPPNQRVHRQDGHPSDVSRPPLATPESARKCCKCQSCFPPARFPSRSSRTPFTSFEGSRLSVAQNGPSSR
jgi:hypothetical protein